MQLAQCKVKPYLYYESIVYDVILLMYILPICQSDRSVIFIFADIFVLVSGVFTVQCVVVKVKVF